VVREKLQIKPMLIRTLIRTGARELKVGVPHAIHARAILLVVEPAPVGVAFYTTIRIVFHIERTLADSHALLWGTTHAGMTVIEGHQSAST
jgi:hypothetical protein